MSKVGCFSAAGLTVVGIGVLAFLTKIQTPTLSQGTAPSAAPTGKLVANTPVAALGQAPSITAQPPAPEPSVTVLRATRVRSAAEEARLKKFVPARVKLRQDLEFRATNQNATIPSVFVGQGREVNVVRINGSELVVEHGGWEATVPVPKTDFLERVIAEVEK